LVGGVLIGALGDADGWRWVLLLNVPFGLITVPLAIRWFPSARPAAGKAGPSLDLPGLALLGALIAWERRYAARGRTPILLPALLRARGYRNGTLIAMCQFGANLSASLALTLYLQDGLGWPALHAALTLLPSAFAFAVVSAIGWRVVGRWGRRSVLWALVVSVLAVIATGAVLQFTPLDRLGVALTVTQLVLGAANGLIIAPNQALTLACAPPGSAGLAAAFLQLAQRVSATVGMAAVAGVVLGGVAGPARTPVIHGLAICAGMLAAAALLSWRDVSTPSPVRKTYILDRT
ncbi:MAG: MFS transporter, partial [Actinoplanes sp.]